jgi:hypothetical protein
LNEGPVVSEHEFSKLIFDTVERRQGETREQAFARVFGAADDDGLMLRKAVAACRRFPATASAAAPAHKATSGNSALDELTAKAEQLRAQDRSLTAAQAFAKVYTASENSELAQRERAEARATW